MQYKPNINKLNNTNPNKPISKQTKSANLRGGKSS